MKIFIFQWKWKRLYQIVTLIQLHLVFNQFIVLEVNIQESASKQKLLDKLKKSTKGKGTFSKIFTTCNTHKLVFFYVLCFLILCSSMVSVWKHWVNSLFAMLCIMYNSFVNGLTFLKRLYMLIWDKAWQDQGQITYKYC
jgi:hypothetical protein